MNILLMGPPGAGKGTQAFVLKDELKLPHVSSGDMFREAIKNKTELGVLAKSFMDKGELVPDEVTNGIVSQRLLQEDCSKGILLDGFPRTIAQAQELDKFFVTNNRKIDFVLNFTASNEVLVDRLTGRRLCPDCGAGYHILFNKPQQDGICDHCNAELYQRKDDNKETAVNRLEVYNKQTQPLLDYYKDSGKLVNINSDQPKEAVLTDIKKVIGEI